MSNNDFNKEENNEENETFNEYTEENAEGTSESEEKIADPANYSKKKAKKQKNEKSPARELLEWVQAIVIAIVLAVVIRNFIFNVVRVEGQSMEGTLQNGDRLIVWSLAYEPKQGDIVVLKNTLTEDRYWIKRVIATEGQHVKIDYETNSVYIDDVKLEEPYINDCPDCDGDSMRDPHNPGWIEEIDVPEDCVFVMGDNRNHSKDGRAIGAVSENDILGKAVLRFWPFSNIRTY